jgi:hypothetical protein
VDPTRPHPPRPEPAPATEPEPKCASFYTARDRRNERRVNLWLPAAALAYAAATAAQRWHESLPRALPWLQRFPGLQTLHWLTWLLAGLATLCTVQAVRSYLVFLREADELLRRIQTEALALGFGVGAAFSLLYPLLAQLGAPDFGGNGIFVVMMLSWSAGIWLGSRRYSRGGGA